MAVLPTERQLSVPKLYASIIMFASCFPSLEISALSYFKCVQQYLVPIYGQGRAFYGGLRICSGTPGIYTEWRPSLYRVQRRILCLL